jgi:hypothetical protein
MQGAEPLDPDAALRQSAKPVAPDSLEEQLENRMRGLFGADHLREARQQRWWPKGRGI